MAPAGLSILTTTFSRGTDRNRALGVWGAVSGLAAATGVFLGGVLSQGPGWRWVLFVNLPVCAAIVPGAYRLVPGQRAAARRWRTSTCPARSWPPAACCCSSTRW